MDNIKWGLNVNFLCFMLFGNNERVPYECLVNYIEMSISTIISKYDEQAFIGNVFFFPKGCIRLIFTKHIENKYYRLGHRYVVIFIIVYSFEENKNKGGERKPKIYEMEKESLCISRVKFFNEFYIV